MSNAPPKVLIAGGGPVGLLAALLLGRRGISVRLFDANDGPQDDPRAATTHPATLDIMSEAGLVEDMMRVGLVAPIFQFWDRPSGEKVAEFDHALLGEDTRHPFVVQCEQFKTARLILTRLEALPNVEVMWGQEVVEVEQNDGAVTVGARGAAGMSRHRGDFLIGADGGRSTVRKQCNIAFDGFTWPERFIVLTTPFDFGVRGYCPRSYFADIGQWCNCFKVSADGPPGLWRTVYPTDPAQTDDELMSDAGVAERMQRFFPAAEPYPVVHRNLYVTHQRVAATFRLGRVLLAGDAAHVNNPIGGLGMNGGIHDALNLAPRLAALWHGSGDEAELDRYSRQRRHAQHEFVQAQTIRNKRELEEKDLAVRRRNLDALKRAASAPEAARKFLLNATLIESLRGAAAVA